MNVPHARTFSHRAVTEIAHEPLIIYEQQHEDQNHGEKQPVQYLDYEQKLITGTLGMSAIRAPRPIARKTGGKTSALGDNRDSPFAETERLTHRIRCREREHPSRQQRSAQQSDGK